MAARNWRYQAYLNRWIFAGFHSRLETPAMIVRAAEVVAFAAIMDREL